MDSEETRQWGRKPGCGYGANKEWANPTKKPPCKQGRSKAESAEKVRLQGGRNQVVEMERLETEVAKEIRLRT